jgi:hypothetical protein
MIYTIQDLTPRDIELLAQSANSGDFITCLGRYYFKLNRLNLVDDEMKVTHDGLLFLRELYDRMNDAIYS